MHAERKVSAHLKPRIYLIQNGKEIAEVRLLGLDFGDFCDILNNGGETDG